MILSRVNTVTRSFIIIHCTIYYSIRSHNFEKDYVDFQRKNKFTHHVKYVYITYRILNILKENIIHVLKITVCL